MKQKKFYRTLTKVLSGLAIGTVLMGAYLTNKEISNYAQKQEENWNKLERTINEPEPRRVIPLLPDVITYRFDENENKRHFIDEIPFGTLIKLS